MLLRGRGALLAVALSGLIDINCMHMGVAIETPSPLCVECRHNQQRIVQQLAAFEPSDESLFDREYRETVRAVSRKGVLR